MGGFQVGEIIIIPPDVETGKIVESEIARNDKNQKNPFFYPVTERREESE